MLFGYGLCVCMCVRDMSPTMCMVKFSTSIVDKFRKLRLRQVPEIARNTNNHRLINNSSIMARGGSNCQPSMQCNI